MYTQVYTLQNKKCLKYNSCNEERTSLFLQFEIGSFSRSKTLFHVCPGFCYTASVPAAFTLLSKKFAIPNRPCTGGTSSYASFKRNVNCNFSTCLCTTDVLKSAGVLEELLGQQQKWRNLLERMERCHISQFEFRYGPKC